MPHSPISHVNAGAFPVRGERHPLGPGIHRSTAPDGGDLLTFCDTRGVVQGFSVVGPGDGDIETCAYIAAWMRRRYPADHGMRLLK